jgi:pimeloyl-ACP methyl ester carboxylesterase
MSSTREMSFRNRDGIAIAATVSTPDGEGPWPGVLLCQGLSGVRGLVLPEVAEHLASAGFASLRFDYAGFGDSEGPRGWIDPAARVWDARFALESLLSQPSVDATRIGVYGHSYGGPVAIGLAAADLRVRALVAVSSPGSGPALLRAARPAWDAIAFRQRLDAERAAMASGAAPTVVPVDEILPFSPAFTRAYRALTAGSGGTSALVTDDGLGRRSFYLASADRMAASRPDLDARGLAACPTLLVNGADDDVAVRDDVAAVVEALPGTRRWIVLPGLGHNDLDTDPGLATAAGLAVDWFTEHLAAP